MGWGVVAIDNLPAHTYLGPYVGDFVSSGEVELRQSQVGAPRYLQQLEPFIYSESDVSKMRHAFPFLIDAEFFGGILGRINAVENRDHANITYHDCLRRGLPEVDYFSRTAISAGTQLFSWYGTAYWRETKIRPIMPNGAQHAFKMPEAAWPLLQPEVYPTGQQPQNTKHALRLVKTTSVAQLVGGDTAPGALSLLTQRFASENNAFTLVVLDAGCGSDAVKQVLRNWFGATNGSYFDHYLNRSVQRGRATLMGFNPHM